MARYMYYTPYFFTLSPSSFDSLMPARSKSIYLHFIPVWILYLQPLLNFLNFVITFKLFSEMAFLRAPQWWKGCKIWTIWWVGKNSPFELCDCFLYFQSCLWSCIIMLKEDFHNIFVGSNSPEMILQGFKSLNIQIWIMVWPHGMPTKMALFASK